MNNLRTRRVSSSIDSSLPAFSGIIFAFVHELFRDLGWWGWVVLGVEAPVEEHLAVGAHQAWVEAGDEVPEGKAAVARSRAYPRRCSALIPCTLSTSSTKTR